MIQVEENATYIIRLDANSKNRYELQEYTEKTNQLKVESAFFNFK